MLAVYCKQHLGPRKEKGIWSNIECTHYSQFIPGAFAATLADGSCCPATPHGRTLSRLPWCGSGGHHQKTVERPYLWISEWRLIFLLYTHAFIATIILLFSYPILSTKKFQAHAPDFISLASRTFPSPLHVICPPSPCSVFLPILLLS